MICCRNCKYWNIEDWDKDSDVGDCVRYAPKELEKNGYAKHPWKMGHQWCGEFIPSSDKAVN